MPTLPLQRLRIWYRKTEAAEAIQPGNLGRVWVGVFQAAGMELAHPEGSKRVRIEMGPALPQGATGEREPFDVWLAEPVPVHAVCPRLAPHVPPGLQPVEAEELGDRLPSLGASLRAARYRALLPRNAPGLQALRGSVRALLDASTLRWVEVRGERVREVDLRSLVLDLDVSASEVGLVEVHMRLVLRQELMGRPSSVLAALGVESEPLALVREQVEVARPSVALRAWRTEGRFE